MAEGRGRTRDVGEKRGDPRRTQVEKCSLSRLRVLAAPPVTESAPLCTHYLAERVGSTWTTLERARSELDDSGDSHLSAASLNFPTRPRSSHLCPLPTIDRLLNAETRSRGSAWKKEQTRRRRRRRQRTPPFEIQCQSESLLLCSSSRFRTVKIDSDSPYRPKRRRKRARSSTRASNCSRLRI